jgi:hypothetical protein
MNDRMTAITLKHPWPYAVIELGKRIENRTWRPPASAIGKWHGLHGGVPPQGGNWTEARDDLRRLIGEGLCPPVDLQEVIRPGIVGVWWLERVIAKDTAEPLLNDPWFAGPYGWVFSKVVKFAEPVPCKGGQGLWIIRPEIRELMRQRYIEVTGVPTGAKA